VIVTQGLETIGQVLFDVRVVAGREAQRKVNQMLERIDLDDIQVGVAVIERQRLFGEELQLKSSFVLYAKLIS
jgi:hypothetical protein